MFILYALVVGLVAGVLTGGSALRLGDLRIRWAPVMLLGMILQLLLFSSSLGNALGDAAPIVYVASSAVVLVAVARNFAIPGLPLVLLGGACNLLAICANGGFMPVSRDAVAAMGRLPKEGYSNSRLFDGVIIAPLTDVFAMPTWVPLANVFSVGDILIGIGVAIAVFSATHGRGPMTARPAPSLESDPA